MRIHLPGHNAIAPHLRTAPNADTDTTGDAGADPTADAAAVTTRFRGRGPIDSADRSCAVAPTRTDNLRASVGRLKSDIHGSQSESKKIMSETKLRTGFCQTKPAIHAWQPLL